MATRLMRQLGIAEEALAIAAKFDPAAGTRSEDAAWLRGKMKDALDAIHAIDQHDTAYLKTKR